MMHVYLLTWCNRVENLYGATLVFNTLRVGFPQARLHVADNASLPACRPAIRQAAEACGASFTQIETAMAHHDFLEGILNAQTAGPAIFVDPDVCFWENVEGWQFDALAAGRLIPGFDCAYTGCLTHPRLHTSFLWVPDVARLRTAIHAIRAKRFEFEPFRPAMFPLAGAWHRFDTGAGLYAALRQDLHAFSETELDAYDHLFCGSHLAAVSPALGDRYGELFAQLHQKVQADHRALKGAWRLQEEYFRERAVSGATLTGAR